MKRVGRPLLLLIAPLAAAALGACAKHNERPGPDAGHDAGVDLVMLSDDVAGQACTADADCAPGRCARELKINAGNDKLRAPEGYCTGACNTDTQCGKGAQCVVPADEAIGSCLASCSQQKDCREGYVCVGGSSLLGTAIRGSCRPEPETQQIGDRAVGRACSGDADCAGGSCASTSPLGERFPGNYCTGRCLKDAECGAFGACLVFPGSSNAGHCFAPCDTDGDCDRDGYRCRRIGEDFRACYPALDPLPDNTAGAACSDDTACGGGANTCWRELPFKTFGDYTVVAAPGGYCTQECSLDADCGANAQCVSRGVEGGLCLGSCASDEDCRAGYRCEAHLRDGDPDARACIPDSDF